MQYCPEIIAVCVILILVISYCMYKKKEFFTDNPMLYSYGANQIAPYNY